MVAAALADGTADRDCVFEVFARRLPHGRRYGVLAGTGRLLEALPHFRFGDDELTALREQGITDQRLLDWLADFRFSGDIDGYAEGDLYFPGSPVLTVRASFAEGVLLETLALSVLNHDSAIASAAARMVAAACERPCIEMGSRRTHEEAAVAAARAALPGRLRLHARTSRPAGATASPRPAPARTPSRCCTTTSGRPSRRRSHTLGPGTTLLVDTYDVDQGIRTAVEVAGPELGGDPAGLRRPADAAPPTPGELLDELGATRTRIVVTSDLDEYAISGLMAAPGRPLRRRHLAGHRLRRAHGRHGLQARRARTASRWPRSPRTRSRSAAASTPSAATTRTGSHSPRSSAAGRSPRATATATSSSPWCAAASSARPGRRAEALAAGAGPPRAGARGAAAGGVGALPRRAGAGDGDA